MRFDEVFSKLNDLYQEIAEKEKHATAEGEKCALACLKQSVSDRIEYLAEFNDNSEEEKMLELEHEIKSLINLMQIEIDELTSTKFDVEFLFVYSPYLKIFDKLFSNATA